MGFYFIERRNNDMVLTLIIVFIAVVSLGFNIKQKLTIEGLILENAEIQKEKLLAEALNENLRKELELEKEINSKIKDMPKTEKVSKPRGRKPKATK